MKELNVNIRGCLMWISPLDPQVEAVLRDIAVMRRRVSDEDDSPCKTKAAKFKYVNIKLYSVNYEEGIIELLSGLLQRFKSRIEPTGYSLKITRWKDHVFTPDFSRLTADDKESLKRRGDQADVLSLICGYPDGFMVDCPTGWGKSYLICQVASILKDKRVAIIVPGIEILNTLKSRLYDRGVVPGVMGGGSHVINRVTLCTRSSMACLAKIDWDVLLYDECHTAAGEVTSDDLIRVFSSAKRIGFSASPEGRTDGADILVEAMFGPVVYRVNYSDAVDRGNVVPIKVKLIRMSELTGPDVAGATGHTLNRYGLWCNQPRNAVIAALAKTFPDDEQTLIMVSTSEHALRLRELLPDFEVVFKSAKSRSVSSGLKSGKLRPVKGLKNGVVYPERLKKLKKDFESGVLKKAIATGIWSAGVDFVNLVHLVRADGMYSSIEAVQRPGRLSRTTGGKTHGYLYDFMDFFSQALLSRSFNRLKKYKAQGWEISFVEDFEVIEGARSSGVI